MPPPPTSPRCQIATSFLRKQEPRCFGSSTALFQQATPAHAPAGMTKMKLLDIGQSNLTTRPGPPLPPVLTSCPPLTWTAPFPRHPGFTAAIRASRRRRQKTVLPPCGRRRLRTELLAPGFPNRLPARAAPLRTELLAAGFPNRLPARAHLLCGRRRLRMELLAAGFPNRLLARAAPLAAGTACGRNYSGNCNSCSTLPSGSRSVATQPPQCSRSGMRRNSTPCAASRRCAA